jgi:hypothetical protein
VRAKAGWSFPIVNCPTLTPHSPHTQVTTKTHRRCLPRKLNTKT